MMIKSLYSLAITETIPVFTDEGIYKNARLASIEVYTTENLHDDMVVVDRCLFEANHIGTTRLLDITNNYHIFMTKLRANFSASAGIQEEVSSPGEPVLFMRDATERSERFEAGILRLVGTNEDTVCREFSCLLDDSAEHAVTSHASNLYGNGRASVHIADVLMGWSQ